VARNDRYAGIKRQGTADDADLAASPPSRS
jgi:hypothetical protein